MAEHGLDRHAGCVQLGAGVQQPGARNSQPSVVGLEQSEGDGPVDETGIGPGEQLFQLGHGHRGCHLVGPRAGHHVLEPEYRAEVVTPLERGHGSAMFASV